MVKSMTAGIAGLRTHQSKMDVISNNIANVNTWGYKSRTANFEDSVYQNLINGATGNVEAGGTGGVNSSQLGYGVNMSSVSTNYSTGAWGFTGEGMNCMIDGTGFFIVGTMPALDATTGEPTLPVGDLGSTNVSLTRVGIFYTDPNGYIVDNTGNYVFGFEPDNPLDTTTFATGTMQPIRIPIDPATVTAGVAGSGEPYKLASVSIAQDGTISGVTSDNIKITIGQLAVALVTNPSGLEQSAGYLYDIGNNAGTVTAIPTVAATTGKILSNYLEMSNVDLATDMANMITTQRGYQANTKIITVTDEMLSELVNMKR